MKQILRKNVIINRKWARFRCGKSLRFLDQSIFKPKIDSNDDSFFPFGLRLGILRISRLSVMSELRIRTSLRTLWRRPFKNKCFKHCSKCIILWLQSPTFQIGHQNFRLDIKKRCRQNPSPTSISFYFTRNRITNAFS